MELLSICHLLQSYIM